MLIIQDDEESVEDISLAFEMRWPDIQLASTGLGLKGMELMTSENPDLVILDLDLADTTGLNVLKKIRAVSNVPVLILTARSGEANLVKALERGADDYMTKPFRQLELLSRTAALIRRASFAIPETLVHGDLSFTAHIGRLSRGQAQMTLTRTESNILAHLMKNGSQVSSYSDLAEAMWGEDRPMAAETIRVHIRRLREKIEDDPNQPQIILTRTGLGYSLAEVV